MRGVTRSSLTLAVVGAAVVAVAAGPAPTGNAAAPDPSSPPSGAFVALAPVRVLDTRVGTGAPAAAVPPGGTIVVDVVGPTGAVAGSAVAMNVTVTAPTGSGYITAFAAGDVRPTASNLNFVPGQTVPNLVITRTSTAGTVALYNGSSGTVQLVADVSGYYLPGTPTEPGTFGSVRPTRALDTRSGNGAPAAKVGPGRTVAFQVRGLGPVPGGGVGTVALNVTATGATAAGYVTAFADGGTRPTVSNLNFGKAQTVPNLVVVPVGDDGKVALYNGSAGTLNLVADVAGYYLAGTPVDAGALGSVTPTRVLDTRTGNGAPKAAVPASSSLAVQVNGTATVPAGGVSAAVVNVTVTGPTGSGYVTAYADGATRPTASSLNFTRGQTVANLVIVPVAKDGKFRLYNGSGGSVQLIVDVAGYVRVPRWQPPELFDPEHIGVPVQVSCAAARSCVAVDTDSAVVLDGSWAAPRRIAPDPAGNGLGAVSCPTTTFCAAMGENGQAAPASTYFAVLRNGTWTTSIAARYALGHSAVSCATESWCWAINYGAELFHYTGGDWVVSTTLSNVMDAMQAISCPSTRFCAAVGPSGQIAQYSDGQWQALPSIDSSALLFGVSCASDTSCVAISVDGKAYRYNGRNWSRGTLVDASGLTSISCPSTTTCVATAGDGAVDRLDGGTWTSLGLAPGASLTSVSCSTVSDCVVVDSDGNAYTLTDAGWSFPSTIDYRQGEPTGVSCWAAGRCVATDFNGNVWPYASAWGRPDRLDHLDNDHLRMPSCTSSSFCAALTAVSDVRVFDGLNWHDPVPALPPTAAANAFGCAPSTTFCIVLNDHDEFATYDGTRWSAVGHVDGNDGGFTSVSCTSAAFCVAVSTSGQSFTFDGRGWSAPVQTSRYRLRQVACASPAFCVAVDSDGVGYVRTGATWRPTQLGTTQDDAVLGLSCPQDGNCVAVDSRGVAHEYSGGTWTATSLGLEPGDVPVGISCWAGPDCVTVTSEGRSVATG